MACFHPNMNHCQSLEIWRYTKESIDRALHDFSHFLKSSLYSFIVPSPDSFPNCFFWLLRQPFQLACCLRRSRYLQLINVPANCKRRRVFGKLPVKSFRSCTANRSKNSKFSRPRGQWTFSTFRLKAEPKTKLRRVSGKITLDTVSQQSKVKLWRFGQVMFSRFCRKDPPNLKHWRLGQITLSTLRVKFAPKVKHWRCVGNLTLSRLRLKYLPKVKLRRELGNVTWSSLSLKRSP